MSHHVDFERLADLTLGLFQQSMGRHDSGVVNQDGNDANLLLDLGGRLDDLLPVRHVTPVRNKKGCRLRDSRGPDHRLRNLHITKSVAPFLLDAGYRFLVHLVVDVQTDNRRSQLCVLLSQTASDAMAGSRYQNNVLGDAFRLRGHDDHVESLQRVEDPSDQHHQDVHDQDHQVVDLDAGISSVGKGRNGY